MVVSTSTPCAERQGSLVNFGVDCKSGSTLQSCNALFKFVRRSALFKVVRRSALFKLCPPLLSYCSSLSRSLVSRPANQLPPTVPIELPSLSTISPMYKLDIIKCFTFTFATSHTKALCSGDIYLKGYVDNTAFADTTLHWCVD